MIRVVYAILAVAIEDLEMYLSNLKLPLRKNAIWFEPLALKKETSKQMSDILYYLY